MHPRMLARSGCSGGTCPAVYDDLENLPGQLVVQGKQASPELLGALTGVADDENAVTIERELVASALRPAPEPITTEEFGALFSSFSRSAFRLETLQDYDGTGPDPEWASLVKANTRWGKTHQRVHVVTEPLTPGVQEELTAGYAPNVGAGEDIRIIAAPEGSWPDGVPQFDFWLFDTALMLCMNYRDDGTFIGAERVTDPQQILEAVRVRDAVLHDAVPWKSYVASSPDLQHRVAQ